MRTVAQLKKFLQDIPDDHQVWVNRGDILAAPRDQRDKFVIFDGTFSDEAKTMARIAVSDFDCPYDNTDHES